MAAKNPNSTKTDAERRAQNKWSAANKIILAAKVSKADGEAFRAWCADRGQTVNAALSAYVTECLRADVDGGAAPAPEIVQAAQPVQAAGGEGLTLPADAACKFGVRSGRRSGRADVGAPGAGSCGGSRDRRARPPGFCYGRVGKVQA